MANLRKVQRPLFFVPWNPLFLTDEDISEIQTAYLDDGMTYREIAATVGISIFLVGKCIRALKADMITIDPSELERMERVSARQGRRVNNDIAARSKPGRKKKPGRTTRKAS